MNNSLFVVGQLGARMHYAVPRILQRIGRLEHLYTDICAAKGWPRVLRFLPESMRPPRLKSLMDREPKNVPAGKITAFTDFGWEYFRRRTTARTQSDATAAHLWAGKTFCRLILEKGLGEAEGIYTFNSAGLEIMQAARAKGLTTVMEQTIVPREIEQKLLADEKAVFPGWENETGEDGHLHDFISREAMEWDSADIILCGSEFVKEGIAACGGPVERCKVVPYGVDLDFLLAGRRPGNGPLRILTVGAIGLRKGSPYVLEAAKKLKGDAQFRMVGPIGITPEVERELRAFVELTGPVPRCEIFQHYAWADVLLLPSICEGSATVTYEALACGLPVICTPNTGSVVRDKLDGFIVPIRDSESIAERLALLSRDRSLLNDLAGNASGRSRFTRLSAYSDRLFQALSQDK